MAEKHEPERQTSLQTLTMDMEQVHKTVSGEHPAMRGDDVEAGIKPTELASRRGSAADDDQDIVDWDGDDDPENPYNIPRWRINLTGILLSFLAFLSPLSSSIVAPASHQIMVEFGSTSDLLEAFVVSVYVLGLAFGPLIWAPLSEIYGRLYVYHSTNLGFIGFTVACAVAPSLSSLMAFRFLAGFFASCILANGGGSIADMLPTEKRGLFMSLFILGPILGPIIGPIGGGFLSGAKGWRWVFWLVTILAGFVFIMLLLFTRETYGPVILQRKAARLRRETGNPRLRLKNQEEHDPWVIFRHDIVRPLRLSVKSPISIICATYMAVVYGILNLMFTSISQVYQMTYQFSPNVSGLAFIGLGLGCFIGVVNVGITSDRYAARRVAKGGEEKKPEYRIFLIPIGALFIPAGLFIYGWTAEYKVHWIVPMVGEALTGFGIMTIFMSTVMYLIDSFTIYAASALAANGLIRSIAGGLLPLAGLTMYARLGVGWGNSVLAFIALCIFPISLVLLRYGERLRINYPVKNL